MSEHAKPATGGKLVETKDINHGVVVGFVVILTIGVIFGFLSMNYLWKFLVELETERHAAVDPIKAVRQEREYESQKAMLFERLVPVAKRAFVGDKQANDADWLEFHVAKDRILVQGVPRAALPRQPLLEGADILDPRHSGAVRDPITQGQDNIRDGNLLLDPKGNAEILKKLGAEKKFTMPASIEALVKKGLLKSAAK
ncbi:MAG: hypothetical protein NT142_11535 [Planctomycetota bacterium]|nr:hypothetical protein [Planctomycetota bacterium]